MNSLTYLSRQFDVLASAKTPPSTPTSDRPSYIGDRRGDIDSDRPLQRVSTWSTKSFLFPPPAGPSRNAPKRSFSSPAFASLQQLALTTPAGSLSSPGLEAPPRSRAHLDIIRRIFFLRVFVLVWDKLRMAWSSLWRSQSHRDEPNVNVGGVEKGEKPPGVEENGVPAALVYPLPSPPSSTTTIHCPISDTSQYPNINPQHQPPLPDPSPTPATPAALAHTSDSPSATSRSSTPILGARKAPFHLPKTLVLDLDETLIHSTSRPIYSSGSGGPGLLGLGSFDVRNRGTSHMVEVVLGGRSTLYHVYKRPFVDFFLRTVSSWYTLVIFTASMQEYADPVIDWLDAGRGILGHRLFRDSCTQLPNGSYTKDLSIIEADLSRVCLVDNSPISYRVNEANGIPIEGWTHDPSDEALLDLLPVLDSLRFTSDVRRVLGLRSAGSLS